MIMQTSPWDAGPIDKVKNWFKDKVKVVADKLNGLFVFPKNFR